MADDNQQWPSEDEDFDAVHSGGPITTNEFDNPQPTTEAPSSTTTVAVISDDDQPSATATNDHTESAVDETMPVDQANDEASEAVPTDDASSSTEPEQEAQEPAEAAAVSEPVPAETEPLPAVVADPPQSKPDKKAKNGKRSIGRTLFELVLVLAIVGLGGWGWKLYHDNKDLKQQLASANANPQTLIQKQTDDLISKVSQLMQLPSGETPTVANVTDAAQAKKQSAFFANAQNGDQVLMYVKAGQAILYRPSTNKIILVAPLTFSNNSSSTTTPSSTTTKP